MSFAEFVLLLLHIVMAVALLVILAVDWLDVRRARAAAERATGAGESRS